MERGPHTAFAPGAGSARAAVPALLLLSRLWASPLGATARRWPAPAGGSPVDS